VGKEGWEGRGEGGGDGGVAREEKANYRALGGFGGEGNQGGCKYIPSADPQLGDARARGKGGSTEQQRGGGADMGEEKRWQT